MPAEPAVGDRPRLRKKGSQCDSCGMRAPDVVGPILIGLEGWKTYEIDGIWKGKPWRANVLLCGVRPISGHVGGCSARMEAFVASGGIAGKGPQPCSIVTTEGGFYTEAEFIEHLGALTPDETSGPDGGRER